MGKSTPVALILVLAPWVFPLGRTPLPGHGADAVDPRQSDPSDELVLAVATVGALTVHDAVLVHPLVYLRLGGDRENHERAGREALQNPESGCPLHLSSSHWHERPASVGMQTLGIAPRPF